MTFFLFNTHSKPAHLEADIDWRSCSLQFRPLSHSPVISALFVALPNVIHRVERGETDEVEALIPNIG